MMKHEVHVQLVGKVKYAALVLFAGSEKLFCRRSARACDRDKKGLISTGWRNSFLPPVSLRAAAAAASFFRLLSKKPGEAVFRQPEHVVM